MTAAKAALNVGWKVTQNFFDGDKVKRLLNRKKRNAMSKIGSFVRRGGRRLTRPAKLTSGAGQPPRAKSPEPNLRTIFFAFDPGGKTLVVGPVRLRTPDNVAQLMEHGGNAFFTDRRTGARELRRYPKRPFMGPALETELRNPKLMQAWQDAA